MKKIIFIFILLVPFVIAENTSFSVILETNDNNLEVISIDLYNVKAPTYLENSKNELIANIISFDNELLYSFDFTQDINIIDADFEIEENLLNLVFPYTRKTKEIIIEKKSNNQEILRIDLTDYQNCNFNEICEIDESLISCPEDCDLKNENISKQLQDSVKETSINEEIKTETQKKEETTNYTNLYLILIILSIIIIFIFIFKKNSKIYK